MCDKPDNPPCNLDNNFAFISYSSKDKEVVWRDVRELKNQGYNIWIDVDLDERNDSWREALQKISLITCSLFFFYISENSLISEPCLEELKCRHCIDTIRNHGGDIPPLVLVETEPIDSLETFKNIVRQNIRDGKYISREFLEHGEKSRLMSKQATTLSDILDDLRPKDFKTLDDKIRIKPLLDNFWEDSSAYYNKLEDDLLKSHVKKFSDEDIFKIATSELTDISYRVAINRLQLISNKKRFYLPAAILLWFIHSIDMFDNTSKECSDHFEGLIKMHLIVEYNQYSTDKQMDWFRQKASEERNKRNYRLSATYCIGAAMLQEANNGIIYYNAGILWANVDNFKLSKKCMELAMLQGHAEARIVYEMYDRYGEKNFHSAFKKR